MTRYDPDVGADRQISPLPPATHATACTVLYSKAPHYGACAPARLPELPTLATARGPILSYLLRPDPCGMHFAQSHFWSL